MAPSKLKPATSINVRHILCEKHSNKERALAAILAGRKFDDVAKEMSEDKARQGTFRCVTRSFHLDRLLTSFSLTGGSLGWQQRGNLIADFEKVAFELEPSTTAKPVLGEVRTSEGYHIIMVEGRK
jgi:NIMA-interacting peptidyl-prolyl cis-trans isomerase 4